MKATVKDTWMGASYLGEYKAQSCHRQLSIKGYAERNDGRLVKKWVLISYGNY
jgi:hypothetical protein